MGSKTSRTSNTHAQIYSAASCHVTMHQRIDLNPLLDPHNDTEDVILYMCLGMCSFPQLRLSLKGTEVWEDVRN